MSADLPFVIVNPKSGKGTTEQSWASVAGEVRRYLGPFECEFTRERGDGIRIAEAEAKKGRRLIVAAGGDGTISEVANGILRARTGPELGILPRGTGGDFRRTLGIPGSIAGALKRIRDGSPKLMDAGHIIHIGSDGGEASRYFINTASFGMSGKVASHANRSSKRLGGTMTYFAATLKTIFSYEHPEITLCLDDQPSVRLKVVTVCLANGPSFGGGMRIAPDARLNDGLFDVVIIGDMKTMSMMLNSHRLYTGSFLSLEKVKLVRAKRVTAAPVDGSADVLLEVDGETPGRLPASFEILPLALKIRC